ncbi:hypothetical protein JCM16303_005471 [Sporobolomyces ruberrimus]
MRIPLSSLRIASNPHLRFNVLSLVLLTSFALASSSPTQTSSNGGDLGFYNPTSNGGSWLTDWPNWWAGGEPLNIIISSTSSPRIIQDFNVFLDYMNSLKFSRQCFQWDDGSGIQQANLGDGLGAVNQTTILRYNYDDPVFGTCSQSLQGGNHLRVFKQNGTQANSGAWFLAVSKEHNLAKNHMIVPNGYDRGRDELIELALNRNGTRSPISKALYRTTVRSVSGQGYFENVTMDEINHGISIDGRIGVLKVEIVEEGNGDTASSNWFTSITLTEFLLIVGITVLLILSLGLFLFIHYHHNKLKLSSLLLGRR